MQYDVTALEGGERVRLRLEAADPADAAAQVRRQGLLVLEVGAVSGPARFFGWRRAAFPLSLFARQLHALLGSGLSLVQSLQVLEERESRPETRKTLAGLLGHLRDGESFSSAAGHFTDAFPPLFVASIRAAERTGDLPTALHRYVLYQEQLDQVYRRAVSASVYPLLLVLIGGLVAIFLLGYVTPRFAGVYEDRLDTLPLASRILMYWGHFVSDHFTVAILFFLAMLSGAIYALTLPSVRAWLALQVGRIPALGERFRIFRLTRFYRTVGMLLAGGIPVLGAFEMVTGLLPAGLRPALARASNDIREGKPISVALERAGLTTPVALRMLQVGEKSGRMGEMMEATAAFHDDETSRFVDWFTRLLEPVLMAVIGLLIGLIVVLLYMPIFDLAGSLQ